MLYLGDISYSLYLVHGPILHTLGYMTLNLVWFYVTGHDDWGYTIGCLITGVFEAIMVIYAADRFHAGVDAPILRFVKWLQKRVVA